MDPAQELYRKNLDLVYANKTLELIRELDEIAIGAQAVEDVVQKFIDTICTRLGFVEGLVVTADERGEYLSLIGLTPTAINKRAMEALGVKVQDVRFVVRQDENDLVDVFLAKSPKVTKGMGRLWSPLVELGEVGENQVYVFPIIAGSRRLGCYAVTTAAGVETMTEFERVVLARLAPVFGLAIDKVRVGQELREAQDREMARVKELDRLKDEFVSLVSHDLRTPMTAIKGYVYLLLKQREGLPSEAVRQLQVVYDSSERMIRLIGDLLDVSRIEAGRMQLSIEAMDIAGSAAEVREELQPQVLERKLSLEVARTGEVRVRADKARVHQVLVNLVSNAIKFTPEGGKITVGFEKKGGEVITHVADTGVGIAKPDLGKLFTKFGRLDSSLVGISRAAGTGLGLYVCKKVVELSGGEIWAESELGKGSTFSFSLPAC